MRMVLVRLAVVLVLPMLMLIQWILMPPPAQSASGSKPRARRV